MVPAIPKADVPLIERIAEREGEFAAYMARFDCARRAAGPSPEDREKMRRVAEMERVLLGRPSCDRGAVW